MAKRRARSIPNVQIEPPASEPISRIFDNCKAAFKVLTPGTTHAKEATAARD